MVVRKVSHDIVTYIVKYNGCLACTICKCVRCSYNSSYTCRSHRLDLRLSPRVWSPSARPVPVARAARQGPRGIAPHRPGVVLARRFRLTTGCGSIRVSTGKRRGCITGGTTVDWNGISRRPGRFARWASIETSWRSAGVRRRSHRL
jgi:hypothetical protein